MREIVTLRKGRGARAAVKTKLDAHWRTAGLEGAGGFIRFTCMSPPPELGWSLTPRGRVARLSAPRPTLAIPLAVGFSLTRSPTSGSFTAAHLAQMLRSRFITEEDVEGGPEFIACAAPHPCPLDPLSAQQSDVASGFQAALI